MGPGGVKTVFENHNDESQILTDQDLTNEEDIKELDENMGAKTNSLDDLENEPAEFIRGEVDVSEQIERTSLECRIDDDCFHGKSTNPRICLLS